MTKNKALLIIVLASVASLLVVGCDAPTVDAVVEHQTEAVESGPTCAYVAISPDIQHRLNHYRICDSEGNEAKRIKALEKALNDCYELCDNSFDLGSDENVICVTQCNEE